MCVTWMLLCVSSSCVCCTCALALVYWYLAARDSSVRDSGVRGPGSAVGRLARGFGRVDVTSRGLERVSPATFTLKHADIELIVAKRLAGAVLTMHWKGHELIAATAGTGGDMQSAVSYDVPPGSSNEEENPTEAGSSTDRFEATTSRWTAAALSTNEFYTKTQMAYFYPPGTIPRSSTNRSRARGVGPVSDTFLEKRVTLGYRFGNVIRYQLRFTCQSRHWFAQYEILTGYMPRVFTRFYTLEGGRVVPQRVRKYNRSWPAKPVPIIVAKSDAVAMGVYCDAWPPGGTFGDPWLSADSITHHGAAPDPPYEKTEFTKWNVVWQVGRQDDRSATIGKTYEFGVCLVVGSVAECAATLSRLRA